MPGEFPISKAAPFLTIVHNEGNENESGDYFLFWFGHREGKFGK
jgi:hypothetical protein